MSASLAALSTNPFVLLLVLFSRYVGADTLPSIFYDPQCETWPNMIVNHYSTIILTYTIPKSTFITTAASCDAIPPSSDIPCDTPCGPVCCGSGQYCFSVGECGTTNLTYLGPVYSIRNNGASLASSIRSLLQLLRSSLRRLKLLYSFLLLRPAKVERRLAENDRVQRWMLPAGLR